MTEYIFFLKIKGDNEVKVDSFGEMGKSKRVD